MDLRPTDPGSNARWPKWERKLDDVRRLAAKLIGASETEIAFTLGTTHGIGLVAEGFPWKEGDNVVSAVDEYPSNVYPWMNLHSRGVSLRRVETREGRIWVEDLAAEIDGRTRLLAISHVEFASGFKNDLDRLCELCKPKGIAIMVDAIQSLGPILLDVKRTPIDFLASGGQKWLLGPEGVGFLYVSRDWIERLRPMGVGSRSVIHPHNYSDIDFTLKPTAQRWEGGAYNICGLNTFGASLELFDEIGFEAASRRILDRAHRVRQLAEEAGWSVYGSKLPGDLSAIVSLEKEGVDSRGFVKTLRDNKVVASWRGGRLRISPHVYVNDEDLNTLYNHLAKA